MGQNFIRIPPDSTGKKIRNKSSLDITIINVDIDSLNLINIGDYLTSTSGGNGFYSGYEISGRNIFTVYINDFLSSYNVGDILIFDNINIGEISNVETIYTQENIITDGDNPNHRLKVDRNGSAYFRFNDGNLNLDNFGNIKMSQSTDLKSYLFYYGREFTDFIDRANSGGQVVENTESSEIRLFTNTTNGSSIITTSSLYFPYLPQQSNIIMMSIAVGDIGKENVVRRWGLYDDDDGVYFELDNTTFSVNIKNSIDNTIHKVEQNDFSSNTLVSEVFDIFKLNISKYNLYWISYQWQGVGVVTFGLYEPNGEKTILHKFDNPNNNIIPYMKVGTLPIRLEQFNKSLVASSSELKCSCISISRDNTKLELSGQNITYNNTLTLTDQAKPLVSLKLKELVGTVKNRIILIPSEFQYYVMDNPIIIEYYLNGNLLGSNFNTYTKFTDIDTDSTEISGGLIVDISFYDVGKNLINIDNSLRFAVNNNDGFQNTITIVGRTLKPSTTSTLHFIAKWKEVL